MPFDDYTPSLALPLPHPENDLGEDVIRLRDSLTKIDAALSKINVILASDDVNLDTLQEVVSVLKAAQGDIGGITSLLATKADVTALRNQLAAGLIGWACAPSGGSAEAPAAYLYSRGAEQIKAALSWGIEGGTAGGAEGNVTQIAWAYSANAGTSWSVIGTQTINYDAEGNFSGASWS